MNFIVIKANEINNLIKNKKDFIKTVEKDFLKKVTSICDILIKDKNKKILLLAGPSGSGKTTTSHLIRQELSKNGVSSAVISLDNFYGGNHEIPKLEDGRPDFESVFSLDIKEIHRCLSEIINNGVTNMPVFDFLKHERSKDILKIDVSDGGILIVEGLHALNPVIIDTLDKESILKVYISVNDSIYDENNNVLLSSRDIRFIRRLSRDAVYRNSTAVNTLHLWTAVIKGEEKYLYCFKETADIKIATLHQYEPCIFKSITKELLKDLPKTAENYENAMKIYKAIDDFVGLDKSFVPNGSLLKEFI